MQRFGWFTTLAAVALLVALASASAMRKSLQPPQAIAVQDQKAPSPEALARLNKVLAEKKTYKVGYTPALERKAVELTGVEMPKDEPRRVASIRAQTERLIMKEQERIEAYIKAHPGTVFDQNHAFNRVMQDYRARHPRTPVPTNLSGIALRLGKFDWNDYVKLTVRDQGQSCQSCWAFAAIGAFEAVSRLQNQLVTFTRIDPATGQKVPVPSTDANLNFSVQSLLNCVSADKGDCTQGGWHGSAFAHIVDHGAMPMAGLQLLQGNNWTGGEYSGKKGPCEVKGGVRGVAWDYVYPEQPTQPPPVDRIKIALMEHGPLAALVRTDDAFNAYQGGVFNEHTPGRCDHAILITGWDNQKKAWRVLNSWGTKWGEGGFMWIAWDSNNIGQWAAWIKAPITLPRID